MAEKMKLNNLQPTIKNYEDIFYKNVSESGKKLSLDDHIVMSKQYVNSLDVDIDTNVELQKYFMKHVEGLYRETVVPETSIYAVEVPEKEEYIFQAGINVYTTFSVIFIGTLTYLRDHNILESLICSAVITAAGYVADKMVTRSKNAALAKIPGTLEYKNKLFSDLEDKLIEMNKLTVD